MSVRMLKLKLLLCVLVILSIGAIESQAATVPQKAPQEKSSTKTDQENALASTKKAVEDYKASLQKLADIYDQNVKTATERVAKMKELLDQGLISKKEYEQSEQALAQAQLQAQDTHNQYNSADAILQNPYAIVDNAVASNSTNWTTGNSAVDGYIKRYGSIYGVDPFLVFCVIDQESGFNKRAKSPKGAQGLMQLMPDTALRYGVTNAYDAEQN